MPLIPSPALVLTPPVDYAAHYPVIGWHSVVTIANIVAEHEDADHPITNAANPATNTRWQSDDDGAQTLTITATAEIDYVAFEGHNFSGSTVLVETLAPDIGASYEEQIETVPGSNETLILRLELHNVIGIKITITPPSGTYPKIAVLKAGKLTTLQRGVAVGHTPIVDGMDVEMLAGVSQGGAHLGTIVTFEGRSSGAAIKDLDPDWYRETFRPFIADANRGATFFWSWSPGNHADEVGYCWLGATCRPQISQETGEYDLTLDLRGIAP